MQGGEGLRGVIEKIVQEFLDVADVKSKIFFCVSDVGLYSQFCQGDCTFLGRKTLFYILPP